MYICSKCKKKVESIDGKFTRCPHCGHRILFKDREPEHRKQVACNMFRAWYVPFYEYGVIHGDPKVANFLFDEAGERIISLFDLDTVKPGLLLHDLGDALRSCCNLAGETPADPEDARFDPGLFAAWLQGYSAEARDLLSASDLEFLVNAVALISFELGLRFYADYLEGDRYFKVASADQNLQRALTQFQLVRSIETQHDELSTLIARFASGGE